MRITATYYLDVVSSWCFWAEPAWAELKKHYEGKVEFQWKIALMDQNRSADFARTGHEWFYRRSGTTDAFAVHAEERTGTMNTDCRNFSRRIASPKQPKTLGVTDDRVRLAVAYAALREGKTVGEWDVAAEIGAKAGESR